MSTPTWPDDPEQRAALLRQLAKSTPIDDSGSLPFVIGPWYFLRYLPSARAVVLPLLEDPDPLVARRAIAHFAEKRDDELWARFIELAEKAAPGPIADDLLRVLERWAQNEAEARRGAALVKRLSTDAAPAAVKAVAVYEPEWLIEITALTAGRDDWTWRYVAELLGFFHPELVLKLLREMRGVARSIKLMTLDDVGQSLALAMVDKPTLGECRDAIGEADAEPRRRKVNCRAPATSDISATLVDFVAGALGCAKKSVTCERDASYTPADVNSPEYSAEWFRVEGTRDGTRVWLQVLVGDRDLIAEVDGPPDERDRILVKLWRMFGEPPTSW